MITKTIHAYFVDWHINDLTDKPLPYDMQVEIHNTIHSYLRNDNPDHNKARAYEYLHKIIQADLYDDDKYALMSLLTENTDTVIAYAGGFRGYDADYIIVVFQSGFDFDIFAFETYNEGDTFNMFEQEEEES